MTPAGHSTSRVQRLFIAGLCILCLILSYQYALKAAGSGARANRSAFLRWRDQILHLGEENIYERYNYPNPPIMAVILEPLANLPPMVGSLGWFYTKIALTVLSVVWIFRLVETPQRRFPPWAKALAIVLSLRPIMGDLAHGNVNLFILFLIVSSLYAFHQKHDLFSGLALGLAIACKVTPALFVPYFLWKRAWKTLAGCALGLVLFLLVIPSWRLGPEKNWQDLGSWVNQMVRPYVMASVVTSEHQNQSLAGLVFRLGTHQPSFLDAGGNPARYDNVLTMSPQEAAWIVKGCMACFACLIVCSCRTPTVDRGGWRLAAEYSLVVLGMLLFSERTWKHHCVTLTLPFAVLCYYLAACPHGSRLRAAIIASLAAVVLLMASTGSTGLREELNEFAKTAQVYGAYVWAYMILTATLAVVLLKAEPSEQKADTSRWGESLADVPV